MSLLPLHRCTVELEVKGIAGGVWTFPITVDVLESKPDDIIVIEAQGLNKETTVGFRLTSMEKYNTQYFVTHCNCLLAGILFHLLPTLFLILMYFQYILTVVNYLLLVLKEASFVFLTSHYYTGRTIQLK